MSRYKRPSMAEMSRQVELFNHGVNIGDFVTYRTDAGALMSTRTRSAAYILSGHTPVVFVEGLAGCVLLDRVTPASVPPLAEPDSPSPTARATKTKESEK